MGRCAQPTTLVDLINLTSSSADGCVTWQANEARSSLLATPGGVYPRMRSDFEPSYASALAHNYKKLAVIAEGPREALCVS